MHRCVPARIDRWTSLIRRAIWLISLCGLVAPAAVSSQQLAAGEDHAIAKRTDGTVWAWGENTYGQLGDGTTVDHGHPESVRNVDGSVFDEVLGVASRGWHNLALKDNRLWAWGRNNQGQLGDGTTVDRPYPVLVQRDDGGPLNGIFTVACGQEHNVAIRHGGGLFAWGNGNDGQLGDGEARDTPHAVEVVDTTGSWIFDAAAVAAGRRHSVALREDGSVWAWGSNEHGQVGALGNAPVYDVATRVYRDDGLPLTNVTAIAAGRTFSVALGEDGTFWAWGENDFGQFGDGTITESVRARAVALDLAGQSIVDLFAGGDHVLTRVAGDRAWTWGSNDFSQLGRPQTMPYRSEVPIEVIDAQGLSILDIGEVATGRFFSLAHIAVADRVLAWGDNGEGQLGQIGAGSEQDVPSPVVFADGTPFTLVPIDPDRATGTIDAPNGTVIGTTDVTATVADPDGIERVWITFLDGGLPLLLCDPDIDLCPATEGTVSAIGIDPLDYGAMPGPVQFQLFVEDMGGEVVLVDTRDILLQTDSNTGTFTLTVQKQGNGDGTITTLPGGITCGTGCMRANASFPANTSVTVQVSAAAGSMFVGYAGERCYGTAPCTLTLNRNLELRVGFDESDPFSLTHTSPIDSATDADPTRSISFTFDRVIALGSEIDDVSLRNAEGADIAFTTRLHPTTEPTVLVVNPDSDLAADTGYTAFLPAAAVQAIDGDVLASSITLPFRTRPETGPRIRMSPIPKRVVEGESTLVHVWFDRVEPFDRVITLQASPPGAVSLSRSVLTVPAGDVGSSFTATAQPTNEDLKVVLSASEPAAGLAKRILSVADVTPLAGFPLASLGCSFVGDEDGDGVVEADEDAEFELAVRNLGADPVPNVQFCVSPVDAAPGQLDLLTPCKTIGYLDLGETRSSNFDIRTGHEIRPDTYWLRIEATSGNGAFVDYCPVEIANPALPNFQLGRDGGLDTITLVEGETHTRRYGAHNPADGYSDRLPTVEVQIVDDTLQIAEVYRTLAEVPGEYQSTDSLYFTVHTPAPGTYTVNATINPLPDAIDETTNVDNDAEPFTLIVLPTNEPPVPAPIPDPFMVSIGELFSLDVSATDADGDDLDFSLNAPPSGMTITSTSPTSARIDWVPGVLQGPLAHTISLTIDDGRDPVTVTFVIEVKSIADLEVIKTASGSEAVPGLGIGYTIRMTNLGPSPVVGARMQDILDPRLTDVHWTCTGTMGGSCTPSGSGDVVDLDVDLPAGATATYAILATIPAEATGIITNSACASLPPISTLDPVPDNNCATVGVTLVGIDFGDAPDASTGTAWHYPTVADEDGARHGLMGPHLGAVVDSEEDGQPTTQADGDDLDGADEDGIAFTPLTPGQSSSVEAMASGPGVLNAWIDWNADGDWDDPEEHILHDVPLVSGPNMGLVFDVPADATSGSTFGRFRFSSTTGLTTTGLAADGEVEDYALVIGPQPVSTVSLVIHGLPDELPEPGSVLAVTSSIENTGNTDVLIESLTVNGQEVSSQGTCNLPHLTMPGEVFDCHHQAGIAGNANDIVELDFAVHGTGTAGTASDFVQTTIAMTDVFPMITLEGSASPLSVPEPGGAVDLMIEVTNLVDAESVILTELTASGLGALDGVGTCALPRTLSPSGTYACQVATDVIGQHGDSIDVVLTGLAQDDDGNTATAEATVPIAISPPQADLAARKTDGMGSVMPGDPLTYTIEIENLGPADVVGARVFDPLPGDLACMWTCSAMAGQCGAATGSGNIVDVIDLLAGGVVTYVSACTVDLDAEGLLENHVFVTLPDGIEDPNPNNDEAADTTEVVGPLFIDGFESGDTSAWTLVVDGRTASE